MLHGYDYFTVHATDVKSRCQILHSDETTSGPVGATGKRESPHLENITLEQATY